MAFVKTCENFYWDRKEMSKRFRMRSFAKACAVAAALIAAVPSLILADTTLVCGGKLERVAGPDGFYFAPVNFDSLRIIPHDACGPETLCAYDFSVYSGENSSVEHSSMPIYSLCSSVFVSFKTKKLSLLSNDLTQSDGDSSVKVIIGPSLDLEGFDLKKITATTFILKERELEYSFHAFASEYLVKDVPSKGGIWHGDSGGGNAWEVYVKQESVLAEIRNN